MLAHFHQRLGNRGQLGGRRVEDDAVVEDPLGSCKESLRGSVSLLLDVLLHAAQVHGAGDVVLVGGEVGGIDGSEERLYAGDCFHPSDGVFE